MNVAAALKAEISRISRKEMRASTEALQKASSAYRSDIASLKRRVADLERQVAKLSKGAPKATPSHAAAEPGTKLRFRAGGFATKREALGLSAREMRLLVGVSALTIYNWEAGKSRPRASQLPAIDAVRKMSKREAAGMLAKPG